MNPLRVLLGPTASGKTAVSLPLAERLQAEIINVDSRQVFRGAAIGAATPTREEQARVPHHLVAILDPSESINAGEFGRLAREAADRVRARGRLPLLVGGSGLYLHAALGGLDEGLPRDPEVRERLRERWERDREALHAELERVDPESAAAISPRDRQRVTRALEIHALTGRAPSLLRTRGRRAARDASLVVLHRDRADLYRRVSRRVRAMIEAGLAAEVEALLAAGVSPRSPLLSSVGFSETVAYLAGEIDASGWEERMARRTRRLAKRQITWFRGLPEAAWFEVGESEPPEAVAGRVEALWKE